MDSCVATGRETWRTSCHQRINLGFQTPLKKEQQKISLLISQLQRLSGKTHENFEHENVSHTSLTFRERKMMNPQVNNSTNNEAFLFKNQKANTFL